MQPNTLVTALLFASLIVSAACGDDDTHHANDQQSNSQSTSDNSSETTANADSNNGDEPKVFFDSPPPQRCAQDEPRCDLEPPVLFPVQGAEVVETNLAEPAVDCELDEQTPTFDTVGCLFRDIEELTGQPVEPRYFPSDSVYEIYYDGEAAKIAVYRTEETDGALSVDGSSFAEGARSRWGFDDVEISEEGDVVATAGYIPMQTTYWGFPSTLYVGGAILEGTATMTENGPVLETAEVRGFVQVTDFIDALNRQGEACLGTGEQVFSYDGSYQCPPTDEFENHPVDECRFFALNCPFLSFFPMAADIDFNDDEKPDAWTVRIDLTFDPVELPL